jgi:hypothetical protein
MESNERDDEKKSRDIYIEGERERERRRREEKKEKSKTKFVSFPIKYLFLSHEINNNNL